MQAIAKYRRVLELNPQKVQAYNNWGLALEEARGNLTGALGEISTGVSALAPDDAQAHFLWGECRLFAAG